MCGHAPPCDYVRSRIRLTDLPALALLHRPVRCPYCGVRSFAPVRTTHPSSLLGSLWVHYLLCGLLLVLSLGAGRDQVEKFLISRGVDLADNTSSALSSPKDR